MKQKKKIICAGAAAVLLLTCVCGADAAAVVGPKWICRTWYYMDDHENDVYFYNWYAADSSGALYTGWHKINGVWYYFDPLAWFMYSYYLSEIDGRTYYFYPSGAMGTGWINYYGTWYYFNPIASSRYKEGEMVTGWLKDGSTWYYLNDSGAMMTGWYKDGSTWYFLKSNGAMAANEWCGGYWLNANGSWTYPYKAEWHKNSRGWWFGDSSGWYAKKTTQKIDGKNYKFDAAGYWVQ